MKTPILTAGLCAALGLAGCATAPDGGGRALVAGEWAPEAGPAEAKYRDFEYGWRDAAFYREWYDASVFVLPPPTGLAASPGVKAAPARADAGALREVDFDGAAAGGK